MHILKIYVDTTLQLGRVRGYPAWTQPWESQEAVCVCEPVMPCSRAIFCSFLLFHWREPSERDWEITGPNNKNKTRATRQTFQKLYMKGNSAVTEAAGPRVRSSNGERKNKTTKKNEREIDNSRRRV